MSLLSVFEIKESALKRGCGKIYKGVISYNLGRNVLFDKIGYGENFLVLYNNTNAHKQIFQNFMRQMAGNGSILLYVSHKTNQLSFPFNVRNYFFNVINDNIIQELKNQIDKCFGEMEKSNNNMLLIADWSNASLNAGGGVNKFLFLS